MLLNHSPGLLLDSELQMTSPGLETFLGPFSDVGRGGNDILSVQAATEVGHQLLDTLHSPGLDSLDLLETETPQPEVVWSKIRRMGRPGSVCLSYRR